MLLDLFWPAIGQGVVLVWELRLDGRELVHLGGNLLALRGSMVAWCKCIRACTHANAINASIARNNTVQVYALGSAIKGLVRTFLKSKGATPGK